MRTIEQISKEYNERSERRNEYIKAADAEMREMIKLEGMAQLINEDKKVEAEVNTIMDTDKKKK